jgi:ubiquinone/menaquinone biosynthesis C-methylase UbiE
MLRVASKKSAIGQRIVEGDCDRLPFSRAAFDMAICSFALGHIDELGAMVRELARVTRDGADVFVGDLHPEAYARGWRTGFRNGGMAIQIEMRSRSVEDIVREFCANGFECRRQVSLWLGKPEEPLFARAGKSNCFAEACQVPAIFVCEFRRRAEMQP